MNRQNSIQENTKHTGYDHKVNDHVLVYFTPTYIDEKHKRDSAKIYTYGHM